MPARKVRMTWRSEPESPPLEASISRGLPPPEGGGPPGAAGGGAAEPGGGEGGKAAIFGGAALLIFGRGSYSGENDAYELLYHAGAVIATSASYRRLYPAEPEAGCPFRSSF